MHLKSFFLLLFFSLTLGLIVVHTYSNTEVLPRLTVGLVSYAIDGDTDDSNATTSILFTGDVMLSRDVERISKLIDYVHPLKGVASILDSYEKKVINFEGSIPEVHQPTPSMHLRFSVSTEFLKSLTDVGITHASLANNHSFDFDQKGHTNTKKVLQDAGIETFGSFHNTDTELLTYMNTPHGTIALIGVHAVYEYDLQDTLIEKIKESETMSDLQVLYVHWGEEYEPIHNERQEMFAQRMIDGGVDLIVGHHPHVVQDIQVYDGALIFYSLGNFVFDQYFDDDVQAGLLIGLTMTENTRQIELIPVSSIGSKVQPRPMAEYERRLFLAELAERSDTNLYKAITSGVIDF